MASFQPAVQRLTVQKPWSGTTTTELSAQCTHTSIVQLFLLHVCPEKNRVHKHQWNTDKSSDCFHLVRFLPA